MANYSAATIGSEFDHPLDSGKYPREGTPNALGVTGLYYAVVVDQEGGRASQDQPSSFPFHTDDLAIASVSIDVEREDGDSVRVWFQAVDYKGEEQYDSVVVHSDSSPPVIQNLWLESKGVSGLALLGSDSLLDVQGEFETYDMHSGLRSIEWWIGTEHGQDDVGFGTVSVLNEDPVRLNYVLWHTHM